MGGHEWYWDVNGLFGVNKAKQSFTGNVNGPTGSPTRSDRSQFAPATAFL